MATLAPPPNLVGAIQAGYAIRAQRQQLALQQEQELRLQQAAQESMRINEENRIIRQAERERQLAKEKRQERFNLTVRNNLQDAVKNRPFDQMENVSGQVRPVSEDEVISAIAQSVGEAPDADTVLSIGRIMGQQALGEDRLAATVAAQEGIQRRADEALAEREKARLQREKEFADDISRRELETREISNFWQATSEGMSPEEAARKFPSASKNATIRQKFFKGAEPSVLENMLKKPKSDQPKPETSSKEVRRKTADGRIGIFDADTKKFLRYAE